MTHDRPARRAFHAPFVVAIFAAALCWGCSAVLTVEPVGSEPVTLDPVQWNGVWCDVGWAVAQVLPTPGEPGESECYVITVVDPAGGTFTWAEVGSAEISSGVVRQEPGMTAMFVTVQDPPGTDGFLEWARLRIGQDTLLIWLPDTKAFGALVDAGALPGVRAKEDVVLDHLGTEAMKVIREHEPWLFDWDELPAILVRITPAPGS